MFYSRGGICLKAATPSIVHKKSVILTEGERYARAQSREWNSSGKDGEAAGTADALQKGGRLEVAMKSERTVRNFCFSLRSLQYGGQKEVGDM